MKQSKLSYIKYFALLFVLTTSTLSLMGQSKYLTREGKVQFHSDASLEKIEAVNNKVSSAIDPATGKIEMIVLIKSFHFEKALMEEHFNENYMESTKYPKATYSASIVNPKEVNWSKDGTYNVITKGNMTMHGVTKEVSVPATITIKKGELSVASSFKITLSDYKIEIPAIVKDKIAKVVDVTYKGTYTKK